MPWKYDARNIGIHRLGYTSSCMWQVSTGNASGNDQFFVSLYYSSQPIPSQPQNQSYHGNTVLLVPTRKATDREATTNIYIFKLAIHPLESGIEQYVWYLHGFC